MEKDNRHWDGNTCFPVLITYTSGAQFLQDSPGTKETHKKTLIPYTFGLTEPTQVSSSGSPWPTWLQGRAKRGWKPRGKEEGE
jgi:hypothetical protein